VEITNCDVAFKDHRGTITDLLEGRSVQHVALFTCVAGSARGNHYHKTATSFIYVLSGSLRIRYRNGKESVKTVVVPYGTLVRIDPEERHELTALEDASFVMMTSGPNGGRQYLKDTVREAV
jgi:uncharacterized RmlC-like cupin family protein